MSALQFWLIIFGTTIPLALVNGFITNLMEEHHVPPSVAYSFGVIAGGVMAFCAWRIGMAAVPYLTGG